VPLRPAEIQSENYSPPGSPEWHGHWDLRFIFKGELTEAPPADRVWKELGLRDIGEMRASAEARRHADVLRSREIR